MSLLTPNAMLRIKRSPASVTTEPASWAPPEFFWRPERAPALCSIGRKCTPLPGRRIQAWTNSRSPIVPQGAAGVWCGPGHPCAARQRIPTQGDCPRHPGLCLYRECWQCSAEAGSVRARRELLSDLSGLITRQWKPPSFPDSLRASCNN